jgi:hypothetical protein
MSSYHLPGCHWKVRHGHLGLATGLGACVAPELAAHPILCGLTKPVRYRLITMATTEVVAILSGAAVALGSVAISAWASAASDRRRQKEAREARSQKRLETTYVDLLEAAWDIYQSLFTALPAPRKPLGPMFARVQAFGSPEVRRMYDEFIWGWDEIRNKYDVKEGSPLEDRGDEDVTAVFQLLQALTDQVSRELRVETSPP